MNYSVNNEHWLEGEPVVKRDYLANKNKSKFAENLPDAIIIHFTAGRSGQSSAKYLADPSVKASAHIVIGREGTVYQLVPLNIISWHAGVSSYGGRTNWNEYSIGIELDNAGPLTKAGNEYLSWFGGRYPENEAIYDIHRNENQPRYWHTFTQLQIEACEVVCRAIMAKYAIKSILGHEEISVGRKVDPGPAFPLDKFREQLLTQNRQSGESLEVAPQEGEVITDKLNIREDASVHARLVSSPLAQGQKVTIVDEKNGWYKVKTEIEGWVNKAYVR